jgi:2-polyprenyl-3-methyl-5-hydroxy-6-metoxy-1,4-benzoquinol methylase
MNQPSPADYEVLTKRHYQDAAVAESYREEYAGPWRLRSLPARLVATRERHLVHAAIADIVKNAATPSGKVLDLPCGTGKLAPVLAHFDLSVVGADISLQMIEIAAREYRRLPGFMGCIQTDAAATHFASGEFDAVVCLRLLHRVPDAVRTAILAELARISSRHVIVSVGLSSPIQKMRQRVRRIVSGKWTVPYPVTRSMFAEQLASAHLTPIRWISVLPLLSSEWIVIAEKRSN